MMAWRRQNGKYICNGKKKASPALRSFSEGGAPASPPKLAQQRVQQVDVLMIVVNVRAEV